MYPFKIPLNKIMRWRDCLRRGVYYEGLTFEASIRAVDIAFRDLVILAVGYSPLDCFVRLGVKK